MQPARGSILGPFRPLIWLFVISGVVLVGALAFLFANEGKPAELPAPVVLDPDERLDEKLDFSAYDWYGAPGRNVSMENFTAYHTISVEIRRHGKEFSHPFTLNFRLAPETDPEFSTSGLEVARYDELTRFWNRVSSRVGSVAGILRSYSTTQPGYYALGRFKKLEGAQGNAGRPETADEPAVSEPASVAHGVVWYRSQGNWREYPELKLVLRAANEGPLIVVEGVIPSDCDLQYSACFYLGDKDFEDDVPQQVNLLSAEDALRFALPEGYRRGEKVIFCLVSVEGELRLKGELVLGQEQ